MSTVYVCVYHPYHEGEQNEDQSAAEVRVSELSGFAVWIINHF